MPPALDSRIRSVKPSSLRTGQTCTRDRLLIELRAPRAPAVMLFGETGAGKTWLLKEARSRQVRSPGAIVHSACVPVHARLPLDPLIALAKSIHRLRFIGDAELKAIMIAPEEVRLQHILSALEIAVSSGPITMQIDDLHWADADTVNALCYCIERLQDLPAHWHLTARPGFPEVDDFAGYLRRAQLAVVAVVEDMSRDELATAVLELAPNLDLDETAIDLLFARTAGNPLYAEMLLLDGGPDAHVSSGLRRLLNERLSMLSSAASEAAAWLAVSGGSMPDTISRNLVAASDADLTSGLMELVERRVAERLPSSYIFRQSLLRDVCYESLDRATRSHHLDAVERSAIGYSGRTAHLDGTAKYDDDAASFARFAWERLDATAFDDALTAFRLIETDHNYGAARRYEARAGVAIALWKLGKREEARQIIVAIGERPAEVTPEMVTFIRYRFVEAMSADADGAESSLPMLEAVLNEARTHAPDLVPRLFCTLGETYASCGDLRNARTSFEHGQISDCAHDPHIALRIRAGLAASIGRTGSPLDGIELLEACVHSADSGLIEEIGRCCDHLCMLSELIADADRFERWCTFGLDVVGQSSPEIRAALLADASVMHTNAGRLAEAFATCNTAAAALPTRDTAIWSRVLGAKAKAAAMLGNADAAREALLEAERLRASPAARRIVAHARGFVSELDGDFEMALVAYRTAATLNEDIGFLEVEQLRALCGIVRASVVLRRRRDAEVAAFELRSAPFWCSLARILLLEAEGYLCLFDGDVTKGCSLVLHAAEGLDQFSACRLRLLSANARGNRTMFLEAIQAFDKMGAAQEAERARTLARAHGLRPSRKRDHIGLLSARESSVAELVANGKTNGEIAAELHITPRTVEYHVGNILSKCSLRSRVEIASRLSSGRLGKE